MCKILYDIYCLYKQIIIIEHHFISINPVDIIRIICKYASLCVCYFFVIKRLDILNAIWFVYNSYLFYSDEVFVTNGINNLKRLIRRNEIFIVSHLFIGILLVSISIWRIRNKFR